MKVVAVQLSDCRGSLAPGSCVFCGCALHASHACPFFGWHEHAWNGGKLLLGMGGPFLPGAPIGALHHDALWLHVCFLCAGELHATMTVRACGSYGSSGEQVVKHVVWDLSCYLLLSEFIH
eukprot:418601-Pelagomonas_calceolata.AAC.13